MTLLPPAIFGLAAAVTLAGCPVGAELEDPERFGLGVGGTGPATGGTGPTGGTAGSGTAGSGTGGSAGGGALVITCDGADHVAMLNQNCARTACHNNRSKVAGIDLTPDANLATRLKDVSATHGEIDCGTGGVFMPCVPETCPPPGDALLVNSASPDDSWLLRKVNGTHGVCGDTMPIPPGDMGFDDARKACLDKLVRAIAALP